MLKKTARFAIIFIIVVSAILGYFIKDLRFNYVFESFFPTDDPALEYYEEFRSLFGSDNNYLILALGNDPSIFDSTFLNKVSLLTKTLSHTAHITNIVSISNIGTPVVTPLGYHEIPIIHTDSPEWYARDSIRIYKNEKLIESLITKDASATAILIQHDQLDEKETADQLINDIRHAMSGLNFDEVHLAGKIYAQGIFIKKMQQELAIFFSASVLLVIVFLLIAFRSWWGVLIPLAVVLLATVWILGVMALTGKPIDLLMVLLPTIMFVVGMSDVVHLITKYIEQLRLGKSKIDAIKTTVKEVGLATFLTSLTTGVGFASLITASVQPIREFGIYTAFGVFIAYIVTFILLPAAFVLLKSPQLSKKRVHRAAWFGFLSRSFINISHSRLLIVTLAVVFTVISLYGASKIIINTYLIEDLPADAPLKADFSFFDQHFGGSRPFELTVKVQNDSITVFDRKVLREIERVQHYLKTTFMAGNIISPVTAVKTLNQALHGGSSRAYRLPETSKTWQDIKIYINRLSKRVHGPKITAKDNTIGRISMRVGDIGSALSLKRTAALRKYIAQKTDTSLVQFKVTGTSNLIDKNNEYLAENMFQGLAIAFFVVAMLAGLLFRTLRMVLITLIPNVIPLLMVAGIMGFFGITLKLSTSIVFTIAFGIAVDDTLHFISKFRIELNKGKSLLYALKSTYLSTGKAIVVTSIILSGGFLILILSSFGGTFYTGLLVSLTLLFALIADLTLLPVLIMLFYKKDKRKNYNE